MENENVVVANNTTENGGTRSNLVKGGVIAALIVGGVFAWKKLVKPAINKFKESRTEAEPVDVEANED